MGFRASKAVVCRLTVAGGACDHVGLRLRGVRVEGLKD